LCAYSRHTFVATRRSTDDGKTWQAETVAVEYPSGHATNAELLVLRSPSGADAAIPANKGDPPGGGPTTDSSPSRVLLLYNERPTDGKSPYAIGVCTSDDGGRSWQNHRRIYAAGTKSDVGCWEPAAVELPGGEIQLFFADEGPYPASDEQQITRLRSLDGGRTWLRPEPVAFRPGHRDGMPVPLLLPGGNRIALAIEDNGLAGHFKPAILTLSVTDARPLPIGADDERRQSALADTLPDEVYAGAPYLVGIPTGATVLSVQSTEDRGEPHAHPNSQMVIYVGDNTAHQFAARSVPFEGLTDAPGLWNSLFVKDAETITALSTTTIDGIQGLWAIDGRVERTP
ncbi:MAG: sialidase family protein, partial [Thermoguttaceae bacterium]